MSNEHLAYLDYSDTLFHNARFQALRNIVATMTENGLDRATRRHLIEHDLETQRRLDIKQINIAGQRNGFINRINTRFVLETIYRAGVDELWRNDDQEFNTLEEWAHTRLGAYMDDSNYLQRFVYAVQHMLLHVGDLGMINTETGEVIDGLYVLMQARISDLKERAFTYRYANTEERQELIQRMLDHAPKRALLNIHDAVMNRYRDNDADSHEQQEQIIELDINGKKVAVDVGEPVARRGAYKPSPFFLHAKVISVPDGWKIDFGVLSERDLQVFKAVFGDRIEIEMGTTERMTS